MLNLAKSGALCQYLFRKHGCRLEQSGQEDVIMPTYSYRCEGCGKTFSRQMTITEHDKKRVKCPKCNSAKTRQLLGMGIFGVKTSKKS